MIASEELVAYGCELQCRLQTTSTTTSEKERAALLAATRTSTHLENVPLSPICIAMGGSAADAVKTTLIPVGTPLPAHVLTKVKQHDSGTTSLWQLFDSSKEEEEAIHLATLTLNNNDDEEEGKQQDDDSKDELVLELTIDGQLKVSIAGGPIVTL
uniref:Uncharacterized protein n=1 Tax=Grammatophora oceanica TaxID=210454 RepID=A0A7S1XZ14_9STRA|mmetsp:Transcript_10412/g.15159  ORF Transcript_10412/g.15159 Transcript_10412/m.15159 type:complete len:156 (+) Transcript_10412:1-468(+)